MKKLKALKALILDFGGVVAEEGFREGLKAIAEKAGLDPDEFFSTAEEIVYGCGYTTGGATEREFWDRIRKKAGLEFPDEDMRREILSRFKLRPTVLELAERARERGVVTALLTDQTNWIEEINESSPFFVHFDRVFNSYRLGKSKKDPTIFTDVCTSLGVAPSEALFVDDSPGHIRRAACMGLKTHLYSGLKGLEDILGPAGAARGEAGL